MLRHTLSAVLVAALLAGAASVSVHGRSSAPAQADAPRQVVFELFGSTCASCASAGAASDVLAEEYARAGAPVVFIEYNSHDTVGNRVDRWYDACPDWRGCYLPMELVDSGWKWSCGPKEFADVYREYVDQALAHPPGADVTARFERTLNDVDVFVQVTNRSGKAIGPSNRATVNAIVFEHARVLNSGRFARAAADTFLFPELGDGQQGRYRVELRDVPVQQWDRAVVVALVDYRPDPSSTHYESLQAAIAVEGPAPTQTPVPTHTPPPTATPSATPDTPTTPTATPVWTGKPALLPWAGRALPRG